MATPIIEGAYKVPWALIMLVTSALIDKHGNMETCGMLQEVDVCTNLF
jgi:hypothetical protein